MKIAYESKITSYFKIGVTSQLTFPIEAQNWGVFSWVQAFE